MRPIPSYQLAAEALGAAANATALISIALGPALPWKALNQNAKQLDQGEGEFSKPNGVLLGQIKTTLLNGIDAYDSASQTIYEWTGLAPTTLKRYIELFSLSDPAALTTQRNFLLRVLDNGIKKLGKAQKEIGDNSAAFNMTSGQLQALVAQLKIDYNENSPYFQNRVKQIIASQSGGWFDPKPDRAKIVAELKAKLKPILEFYVRLSANVQQAFEVLNQTLSELNGQIQVLVNRSEQIEAASHADGPVYADTAEHRDAAIHAAQSLIDLSQAYRQAHA